MSKEGAAGLRPELVIVLDGPAGPDTEPPSAPPNLVATEVLSTSVAMAWGPSTDNVGVVGYDVSRNGVLVASLGLVTTFQDLGLDPSTTYQYDVTARDAAGNVSLASTLNVATTPFGSSVRLTAGGDHGASNNRAGQTVNLIVSLAPDAHLALGDMSYSELDPESAWCDWIINGDAAAGVVGMGSIPFELVVGNHKEDSQLDGFVRDFAACLPDARGAVGDYGTEYYFDVEGQVPVIMIGANHTVDGELYDYTNGPHRAWLEQTVTDARAQGIPWVVVGMHKLCVSGATKTCEIGDSVMDWLLAPGRADLVLHGHSHSVQRSHQLVCVDPDTVTAACIVDSDGHHVGGDGEVLLIGGTFGRSADEVDTGDSEIGYFAAWMHGGNTPSDEEQGIWQLDFTEDSLVGQWVGSTSTYSDAFTITAPNFPPVAVDDGGVGFTTAEDVAFTTADVLTNDTDPNGDPLSVTGVDTAGTVGGVVDNGDGTFDYTPLADFNGTDSFGHTVSDPEGASDTGTVTITVTAVNDPPVAVADGGVGFTTAEDVAFTTADVLTNDTDVEADPLSVTGLDTAGTVGGVVDNTDGTFGYTPPANFNGSDSFDYTVSDPAGASDTATVTITVTAVNDPPVAVADGGVGFTTAEDVAFTTASVLTNDTDVEGVHRGLGLRLE